MVVPTPVDVAVSVVLWVVLALYLAAGLYWSWEMLAHSIWYTEPAKPYGAGDVQVRIVTVGNRDVVQETVNLLPVEFDDIHVISEVALDIVGADVHVVPDDFACAAKNKGRALEWGRVAIPCEREFVLFLDEDSVVQEFSGLPDADIVQFTEFPQYTGNLLTYLTEIYRLGYQYEQRGFPDLRLPLYAWGGGLAIRKDLEDRVTWAYDTIIEDTIFVWRATLDVGASMAFVTDRIANQAPPTVRSMIRQRRRWMAGGHENHDLLPTDYVLMYGLRDLSWAVTSLVPVLVLVPLVPGLDIYFAQYFSGLSMVLLGFLYLWVLLGIVFYKPRLHIAVGVLLLVPVLTVLHSLGATWGFLSSPTSFDVTEKVTTTDVEREVEEGVEEPAEVSSPEPASVEN